MNQQGYVLIKLSNKPWPERNWKSEHIHIMEQHLGRELLPPENIHHKNGVRNDNRLENLELWSGMQPPGQRVTDLLAWAREIIALYGAENG